MMSERRGSNSRHPPWQGGYLSSIKQPGVLQIGVLLAIFRLFVSDLKPTYSTQNPYYLFLVLIQSLELLMESLA